MGSNREPLPSADRATTTAQAWTSSLTENSPFSGKTSLAQSLSTVASTAAFDKNPQSKERGITLDLGFSSFAVDSPDHLKDKFEKVQYTLVDCPGHGEALESYLSVCRG